MRFILGQLWCLIVSIPDFSLLSFFYFESGSVVQDEMSFKDSFYV